MRLGDKCLGRWQSILLTLGLNERDLSGKHGPCPGCGGRDRFRYVRDDRGGAFCGDTRIGDGFELLNHVYGWDFKTAAKKVEDIVGKCDEDKAQVRPKSDKVITIFKRAKPYGPAVEVYLRSRGLTPPTYLGEHRMEYWDITDSGAVKSLGEFDVMVGSIRDPDGKAVAAHVTYLQGSGKAPVPSQKKIHGSVPDGGAVRLYEPAEVMGVAEGIETAIAASMLHRIPVWAALNTGGMKKFAPPMECKKLIIFGDNDESGAGQAAAYHLMHRLHKIIKCEVQLPEVVGDFNDMIINA